MSIDLTEAVDAAARAWFEKASGAPLFDDLDPMIKHRIRSEILPQIVAAAPIIAAQALRDASAKLTAKATLRFEFGPDDARGAAIWDSGIYLHEDLAEAVERSGV